MATNVTENGLRIALMQEAINIVDEINGVNQQSDQQPVEKKE